jgi:phytoene synthase
VNAQIRMESASLSRREADAVCLRMARRHYENFSVASLVVPRPLRLHLARIYAYCRTTDDLGDESGGDALWRLHRWRSEVEAMLEGRPPVHPVLVALAGTVARFGIPAEPFLDLIAANVQDQRVSTYATWKDLRDYCMLSAAPVGRMVLRLFEVADPRAVPLSDDVCIGLQLANFAQDVGVDRGKGRTYLIQSEMNRLGLPGAVEAMCERALRLLGSGRELERLPMPGRLRLQLSLYRKGGEAIIAAIRREGFRTDGSRPEVSTANKLRLVAGALSEGVRGLPGGGGVADGNDAGGAAAVPGPSGVVPGAVGFVPGAVGVVLGGHVDGARSRPRPAGGGASPVALTDSSLAAAERYCQRMARREAGNFYWGFIALPRTQRISIYALYDFARQIDDATDGPGATDAGVWLDVSAGRHARGRPLLDGSGRDGEGATGEPAGSGADPASFGSEAVLAPLDLQRQRLRRALAGDPDGDPVMQVLARAVRRHRIPASELEELVSGVEMDLHQNRYPTWEELSGYCQLVAGVVGRMCVRIFGFDGDDALERADSLGAALQLINILRDVREDASLGRVYLPQDELARFGVSEASLLAGRPDGAWTSLVEFEAARARRLYATGIQVCDHIPGPARACVRTMAGIYSGILDRIEAEPELPLRQRVRLSSGEKAGVMLRSWVSSTAAGLRR